MFMDFCFFIFALAIVGFIPMTTDVFLGIIGYSVYLTLREWIVILYCFLKVAAGLTLMFGDIGSANYGSGSQAQSTQIFGKYFNAGFHLLSAWYVGRSYYYFRKNGGIWGTAGPNDITDNKFVKAGMNAATSGA